VAAVDALAMSPDWPPIATMTPQEWPSKPLLEES
jgi:hypothetical protein